MPQLFERARIIRQMFFPNNDNMIAIHFALQPTYVAASVAKMQLTVNGQTIQITPGLHTINDFIWPSNNPNYTASVMINDINQQVNSDLKTGPFALFRLLNDAQLQTTNDPKRFIVTFNSAGGVAAQYQLIADNVINPFIPNIIDQFRCPVTF